MSFLTQNELFTTAQDGSKVPIAGYELGKDGIVVPIDPKSYSLGKDATIIPNPGYSIGKNGLIVKTTNATTTGIASNTPSNTTTATSSSNSTNYLTQNELYNVGKNGVKVPIPGYEFGKDGIIVPIDPNSYSLGKDGVIIPNPGYIIGKGGLIVEASGVSSTTTLTFQTGIINKTVSGLSSQETKKIKQAMASPGASSESSHDFSKSNLILMVGGQILILVFLLMIVFFGTAPLSFPANAVREMVSRGGGLLRKSLIN